MKLLRFFLIPFILSLPACSIYHVNFEDTSSEFYPPKTSADQIVYMEKLDRPHDIIGYVTVNTERNQRMSDILVRMKHEAAVLGADAITDVHTDASGMWKKLPAQHFFGNGFVRANFKAAAVVFK